MQQPQPSGRPVPSADRRGPALRCCPHRVRVLPASATDDRELPAVPSAQGLALRRPIHELHQGGESRALPGMPLWPANSRELECSGVGVRAKWFLLLTDSGRSLHISEPQFPQCHRGLRSRGEQRILSHHCPCCCHSGCRVYGSHLQTNVLNPWVPVHCSWLSDLVR